MKEKFEGNGIFPKGPKNEAYAQYQLPEYAVHAGGQYWQRGV